MQHNFVNDIAGRAADEAPRWLRLTRAGETISGFESADGAQWTEVDSVHLPGLPETVQVGLFVASPGDLTLRSVALGAQIPESRFTQATAVFDNTSVDGAIGGWNHGSVGDMGHTDWERHHRPPGLVETDGTFTVTGTGDIGPVGAEGGHTVTTTLLGLTTSLVIVLVVAARFVTVGYRGGAALTGWVVGRIRGSLRLHPGRARSRCLPVAAPGRRSVPGIDGEVTIRTAVQRPG